MHVFPEINSNFSRSAVPGNYGHKEPTTLYKYTTRLHVYVLKRNGSRKVSAALLRRRLPSSGGQADTGPLYALAGALDTRALIVSVIFISFWSKYRQKPSHSLAAVCGSLAEHHSTRAVLLPLSSSHSCRLNLSHITAHFFFNSLLWQ